MLCNLTFSHLTCTDLEGTCYLFNIMTSNSQPCLIISQTLLGPHNVCVGCALPGPLPHEVHSPLCHLQVQFLLPLGHCSKTGAVRPFSHVVAREDCRLHLVIVDSLN